MWLCRSFFCMNCCEQEEHCETGKRGQLPAAPKEWFQSKERTGREVEHGFLVQPQEAFGCGASLDHILAQRQGTTLSGLSWTREGNWCAQLLMGWAALEGKGSPLLHASVQQHP